VPSTLSRLGHPKRLTLHGSVMRTHLEEHSQTLGLRFKGLVSEQAEEHEARFHQAVVGLAIALLMVTLCVMKIRNVVTFWYEPVFQGYSIAAAAFILSRIGISFFYKVPEEQGYLPAVSMIITAKNEETNIAETIRHCFQSRYPEDLVEVIAVDDGSTDGTWAVMKGLEPIYPRLRNIQLERNMGKRHAMAIGAEKAQGKILVYVDSDSYADPEGLYRIVQPFFNPRIGAVAGHTMVRVREDNFISKMESVRYFISHQVIKTAESVYGAVTCCPGAFSAYRRELVMKVLPAWLNQRFFGTQATFGDDRSLTNFILRTHQVVFHASARAYTETPEKWSTFFRQQLRWKKSWMRETTIASRIMLRKHPVAALFYYIGVMVTLLSPVMAVRALVYLPTHWHTSPLPYLTGLFLVYLLLCLIFLYKTRARYWYCGMAFAALYVLFFSFQNYYAMLTVSRNHWGTR
jgi:hyaluronan synthase